VLGIVVVIVAILGIAVWGATGEDPGAPVASASGGGAGTGVPVVASPAPAKTMSPAITPVEQIERWRKLREQERGAAESAPPAVTSPLAGSPGATPGTGTAFGDAIGPVPTVALKSETQPFASLPVPEPAAVTPMRASTPPPAAKPVPLTPAPAVTLRKPEPVEPKVTTLVIGEGDTLWKIANRHYGDSDIQEHVDAILSANPDLDPDSMKIGTRITLPPRQGLAVSRLPAEKQVQLLDGSLYQVQKGDTLSGIAKAKLGSALRWQDIYDLNRERIVDPSILFPGTSLRLPKN
jgi:nucleoid-associated protein YgaU